MTKQESCSRPESTSQLNDRQQSFIAHNIFLTLSVIKDKFDLDEHIFVWDIISSIPNSHSRTNLDRSITKDMNHFFLPQQFKKF
jgi:hypothetical protein